MKNELRPFWQKLFTFDWRFGLFLLLIICIPRFVLMLAAYVNRNYASIGLIMLLSAIFPYIFLSAYGRKEIGIRKVSKFTWLIWAILFGLAFSSLLFLVGQALYGNSHNNWYYYIGRSYNIPPSIGQHDKLILFSVTAITGMLFSPIGEEFFFRGLVQTSFARSFGELRAALLHSSTFAIVHIAHFGLVFVNQQWHFLPIPTLMWVFSMFLVSLLFTYVKKRSGSLFGAILCHSAFNLGMTYCIFYLM